MRVLPALLPLALGCAAAWHDDFDRLRVELDSIRALHDSAASSAPGADLAGDVDLETLVREARRRNPELRESAARSRAALEEVRREGALDDPRLRLQTEGPSLHQPAAFDRAGQNMIMLGQAIPFPGNLSLRSEAALREAERMNQMRLEREREVVARVKRAYFEYYALARELDIHREHVAILEDFEKASEIRFRTGAAPQQDVLRPQVEQVRLHADVFMIEQRLASARAAINVLVDRAPESPLGPPREPAPPADPADLGELMALALSSRPELRAAEFRVRAAQASLALAEREAALPDFDVEAGYMHMTEMRDGWAGMLGINLPWLTGKKAAEARRAGHALRADEAALEATRSRVRFEVRDAWLRVEAARKTLALYAGELVPKSAQTVEVSRAGYEKDKASFLDLLDSERSLRDVKLERHRALAAFGSALADLERAVGADPGRKP